MNRERLRFWLYTGAALLTGLLLRLWFVEHFGRVAGDSLLYGDIAKNWLRHGIYGFAEPGSTPGSIELRSTLIRLPGYPFFLAACFRLFGMEHYRAVLNLQIAADLLTCCLSAALASRLFGRRAFLPVLWVAALCPFTANYVAMPLTETLVLTTIALALYAFLRWLDAGLGYNRWLWITAAALASSLLLRPDQGLLAAAILPAMLWRSLAARNRQSDTPFRAALPAFAVALCIVLPLVPWTARNWHTFHRFQPLAPRYANDPGELAPLGFARWYRSWAIDFASTDEVYWDLNGDRIELTDLPPRAYAGSSPSATESQRRRTAALLAEYNATVALTRSLDLRFAALATERFHQHPILCYLGLPTARLLNMAFRPRIEMMPIPDEWWRSSTPRAQTIFAASYATLNFAYFALAFTGLYLWRRHISASDHCLSESAQSERKDSLYLARSTTVYAVGKDARTLALAMAASILLRALLLLTLDNSEPRYTLEFFPILFVWIGVLFAKSDKSPQKL